jgi:uncharacterized protein
MGMGLDRDAPPSGPIVTGFSGHGFRIHDAIYPHGLLLSPEWARDWNAPPLQSLDAAGLAGLLAVQPTPEFFLLGTGASMRRPPAAFTAALDALGLGIEAMDSRAAARAWGLLRGEGRWIVAALLPLS